MFSSLAIIIFITVTGAFAKDSDELMDMKKSEATKTFYDQRQTGKYNVHVNIKDVQFFSLSDSLGNVGGDYAYGDYEDYDLPDTDSDSDYDHSHLTVNPILALLGAKPTKTTTTTTSTTEKSASVAASSTEIVETITDKVVSNKTESPSSSSTVKQELDTTVKQQFDAAATPMTTTTSSLLSKPALKPLKVNESIEYEEIPVEVQYYRGNHPKLANNERHYTSSINKRYRRPPVQSVQILSDARRNNNVKIVNQHELHETVKICGRGEFRDSHGRCRLRAHNGKNRVAGL